MINTVLLGGYTAGNNKGVAKITLDKTAKALKEYAVVCEMEKPTYLLQKEGRIYACMQEGEQGGMAKIVDGKIVDKLMLGKVSPCHISWDEKREVFYLSNYHEGTLYVVAETEQGLCEVDRIIRQGSSVHPNQEKSHIHFAQISPCGRFLFVCDLGTDEVILYQPCLKKPEATEKPSGKLKEHFRFQTPAGFGPRHLTFHPVHPIVYVLGELSNQILVLHIDPETGNGKQVQILSMLPEGFQDTSAGAAIRITKDGKYLYASNRGHNSIVIYRVREDGTLQLSEHVPTYGDFPRDFALDSDEEYLLVAHQKSDNLTLFKRDCTTGGLLLQQKEVYAPECVCVCFTDKEKL